MADGVRAALLRLLKVPPEPTPPPGESGDVRVFRAAHRFYRYKQITWGLRQLGALAGLFGGLRLLGFLEGRVDLPFVLTLLLALELFAWLTFLLQLVIGFLAVRLDFEMRWYMLTDRSMRVREGVFALREKTITYANVQEIAIRQNPLQRLLRIADVRVRSAGGGAHSEPGQTAAGELHAAYFHGVDRPQEIRDLIRARVQQHRDSGLGDPDDVHPTRDAAEPALRAARTLLAEAQALRSTLLAAQRGGD